MRLVKTSFYCILNMNQWMDFLPNNKSDKCQTCTTEKKWRSQNFSEKKIFRKENLKKCTSFEEQKCTRYIIKNNKLIDFDITSCKMNQSYTNKTQISVELLINWLINKLSALNKRVNAEAACSPVFYTVFIKL